ncbi:hypothetical protein CLPUN_33050 [Clostridium puniceum]|uniref:TIGR04222 domain-containing membrane protein n=1 Tax=Clostridium puniceum TaxID=29367 RepID=A0A1S8TCL8_9CLOT|nr:hypothetical protein [Clostridium puniceum]OOM75359.1 hypothetical protein CLPUN_33050 [Clostridium puniceum]
MRFLPFIKGADFLVVYAIFSLIGIILILKKLKRSDKDYIISDLDDDKYYVLKNNYSLYNMFYFITYKLCAKGILIKDEKEKKFYVNKDIKAYLSDIEEQVCALYLEKFAPKDFKSTMVIESHFKVYYDNINNELKSNGLIKDSKVIEKNKNISNIGLIFILIPGVLRLVGGIFSEMPVTALIIEIVIIFIVAKAVFSAPIKYKLTSKGEASINAYEKYYEARKNDNNRIMDDLLMTNSWMYFLGVSNINNNNSSFFCNDNSSGSCSSCSSGSSDSSGSSCSSCSSCGGCGGD